MKLPLNLQTWIEDHRDKLKPPVGNCEVFPGSEYIVMIVGGPNSRQDYHINEGPEFFYQLEGSVNIRILENGKPKDIPLHAGEVFVLPGNVPHSPQRFENTVGLVIEQIRKPQEKDGFLWICENCHTELYREYVHVTDIVKQLPIVFDHFYTNKDHTTCKKCGTIATKPK
ncbi:MAG: 3-hydroxyanthranilate 3,4-dioxygenase [Bdellovibrionales bacterium]|nr:3-hydroxyanthranilate 3,4-dioxygenase [Bdellovibrionales bacterium]